MEINDVINSFLMSHAVFETVLDFLTLIEQKERFFFNSNYGILI